MAQSDVGVPGSSTRTMVPYTILFILLSVAVIRSPSLISSNGIGSAVIVVAPLILATYALTAIVMAGRGGIDLSIGPLIGFINVGLIKSLEFGYVESPIAVFLYAIMVGVAYQLVMGLIIVYVRVQPIIVSLSGYLALVGLNLLILPRPGGVAPDWMLNWGSGTSILSPVLFIVVVATLAWYVIARTAFFGHLRLMGSDERAAYTSGVKINIVRLGAHCIGGVYAGLAAICYTALISSGDPTQGTTFTLMAVTALVLGGANLAGGRGGAIGSLLGALSIYMITYLLATFNLGTIQSYVADLAYGTILVVSLLISTALPQIERVARYLSPPIFFAALAAFGAGIILHATLDVSAKVASAVAVPQAVAAPGLSDGAFQAGTTIMLVVIGIVALSYLVGLLIRHLSASMVALVVVLMVIGMALVFHPHGAAESVSASNQVVAPMAGFGLDYFSLEGIGAKPAAAAGEITSPVVGIAYGVMLSLAVILLVSIIISLNLGDVRTLRPETLRLVLLGAVGLAALALISIMASRGGAGGSGLFGAEGLTVAAVAVVLFVLMWSPLQSRISSIANVYIVALGLLAVGSLYFSAPNLTRHAAAASGNAASAAIIRPPAKVAASTFDTAPAMVSPPVLTGGEQTTAARLTQVSYSILVILALHLALWMAISGRRLRGTLRFGHIIVGAALAWGALFYVAGVSLTNVAVIALMAIATAPLVWWVVGNYAGASERRLELSAGVAARGRTGEART